MGELEGGLFPLFFGQLLFKCFLFRFPLFQSLGDSFSRAALLKSDPQILNGFISFLDFGLQSLDRQILTAGLTGGYDLLCDDLNPLGVRRSAQISAT